MADLTIVVQVENNKTVSHFSIPPSGKLVFRNGADAAAGDLVIASKSPTVPLPFCKANGSTPKPTVPIAPGDSDTFWICKNTTVKQFDYSAQIGQAEIEDPIVIIERTNKFSLTPLTSALIAAVVGAAITYLIMRSRAGRTRPQQG